jgi:uncharacterized protein with GYD domain
MVTYVVLANFTDQGIRNAKDSPKRAEAFKKMAETLWSGCKGAILDAGPV